ncbi:MAG: GAF domain-containing protein [Leptolyngbyaceae cyanobacterium bins.302]|nr:GAF domain-containing protein [Leptolyngbyaceae cyanobacterium bins.302]
MLIVQHDRGLCMAKILIVEDETVAAQSIQTFLEASAHQILAVVETGSEAIQRAADLAPDLVLMDIYLRDEVDGIAAADRIYQELGIPIIFLSANTEDSILQRAVATKPFGYLVKPFNQTELITAINIALQRHRLEKQLEQTEQWLATTLNSIGDGTIATDKNGAITFINPVAEAITGWQQGEALGTPVDVVLNLVDASTQEAIDNPLLQAMQENTTVTLPDYCILRTKQGLERVIGDSAAPIRDRNGEILGGILVFQDITTRKQAEDLLYQREQEFRALVENSPDIVARFDPDLRHLYVNPSIERLTGVPMPAFIGKTNREMGMPETLVNFWEAQLRQVFATAQEQQVEFEAVTLNGLRYFQARIVPELTQGGQVATVLSVTRDITDRKQTEEALRLQVEREELLGVITQRIRESLELEDILNTAVTEVRHLLHADRVVIYRFDISWSGFVIVESLAPGWTSIVGREIYDPCLATDTCIIPFTQGRVGVINNVATSGLADCYVDLLNQLQVQANLVIPVLEADRLWGLIAVQQCSAPRDWQAWEVDFLTRLSTKLSIAIQQSQLYQQTQMLVLREQSLNRVVQAVRNSLDLATIFDTAVAEIGELLHVDQVSILQYLPAQKIWVYLAIYHRNPEQASTYLGLEVPDEGNPHTAILKQGAILRVDDATTLEDEFSQIMARTFPGGWLNVPLQVGDTVWGAINLVQHEQPFVWQDWQVELTCTIADQLAIAIHQSRLYTEVQRLNVDLESQVLERTSLLQQALNFEALLKRITDKVRDSLDEQQILETAVTEVGQGLSLEYCGAAIYSADLTLATITHEFTRSPAFRTTNREFRVTGEPASDIYNQLFQAQHCQFCLVGSNPLHPAETNHAILACPIWDDQDVLGDIWLFRAVDETYSEAEIRLVEQVANQCAIALRQSRLYQATQAQVTELERLNQLKDDFLSTISHELRTPMASIKMAIQLLDMVLRPLNILDESTPASRYFQILERECDREIALIDNLLKLSRLDSEAEPLTLSTIDLGMWIGHAVEPFADRMQTQDQTLVLDLPAALPPLTTDLSALQQILSELLTNACKYSPSGSTITIFARATQTTLQVGITNTGVEIPAAEFSRIFDKFYRIPNPDPWRYEGTGIGLALVKKLVAHLGATIAVASRPEQTTFTVTFPLDARSEA